MSDIAYGNHELEYIVASSSSRLDAIELVIMLLASGNLEKELEEAVMMYIKGYHKDSDDSLSEGVTKCLISVLEDKGIERSRISKLGISRTYYNDTIGSMFFVFKGVSVYALSDYVTFAVRISANLRKLIKDSNAIYQIHE